MNRAVTFEIQNADGSWWPASINGADVTLAVSWGHGASFSRSPYQQMRFEHVIRLLETKKHHIIAIIDGAPARRIDVGELLTFPHITTFVCPVSGSTAVVAQPLMVRLLGINRGCC